MTSSKRLKLLSIVLPASVAIVMLLAGNLTPAKHAQTIPTLDSEEWAFLTIINNYRAQNGQVPLQVSVTLTNAAKWKSNDMATKNYFDHYDQNGRDPATRMSDFGYPYTPKSENIAAGNALAQDAFDQWRTACDADQSGACTYAHNRNMLDSRWRVIGIGRAFNANSTYGWYWTTDFGAVVDQTIPPPSPCTYSLSALAQTFASDAGAGGVDVIAPSGCTWTAVNNNPSWITVTSPTPGSGNGTLTYSVTANTGTINRTGSLTIAGITYTIAQAAPGKFLDVNVDDTTSLLATSVGKLVAHGITSGCGQGNFCPDGLVTRLQMAIFIERALGVFTPPSGPATPTFADVPNSGATDYAYEFIEDFVNRGITAGCQTGPPRLYCPGGEVTRMQMAIFIERALGVFSPPSGPATPTFADVPNSGATDYAYEFIEDFVNRRITAGCQTGPPRLYCPSSPVTRGQMAIFLVRAFGL